MAVQRSSGTSSGTAAQVFDGRGGTAWNSTVFQHAGGRDALRAVLRGVEPVIGDVVE